MKQTSFASFVFGFFCCLLLFSSNKTLAQGEGNVWYFGFNAGVDFNSGSPVALTNGALFTNEGCASISSSSGALKFYTNGVTVWNNNHLAMPNGMGLLGNSSATQSAIIVPKPGNSNIYYVFTVAANDFNFSDGLRFSEVDMTLDGGLGDVTSNKNIILATSVTEKITAVKKANGIDYWVIAHDFATTSFFIYSVTSSGVDTIPIVSNAGSVDNLYGVGYLKASTDGSKLAQAIDYVNVIDVLNFNNTTGEVTSNFTFTPPLNGIGAGPYGVEFSPDGQKLYAAIEGTSEIYQYNLALGNSSAIINSGILISPEISTSTLGALQIGPDGKIYAAKLFQSSLACINNPNEFGLSCNYENNAVSLDSNLGLFGLPNFIPSFIYSPSIPYYNKCLGDTTYFSLADTSEIDSVRWRFNDPATGTFNSSTSIFPSHIFSATGAYSVSVITHKGAQIDTLVIPITILSVPMLNLGNDTTLCVGSTIELNPGEDFSGYSWQNASTNPTFTVSTSGTYYVSASHYCGTKTDTIHISEVPKPIVTVNSPTICSGVMDSLIANGAISYSWNTGSNDNPFIISPTSTTNYSVIGTDLNGCKDTAVSMVTVNPLPIANAGSDVSICSGTSIEMNASGGINYSWSPNIGLSNASISNPVSSATSSTTYSITVTDANNCTDTDEVLLTVYPTPITNFSSSNFCLDDSTHFTDLSVDAGINWNWSFGDGTNSNTANPIHHYVTAGEFLVSLISTGQGGCNSTVSKPITIYPIPATPISSSNSPVCVGDTISLSASTAGSMSYFWSGPNNFVGLSQNSIILEATESMAGKYFVFVSDNTTGCISDTSSAIVLINGIPNVPDVSATSQLCYGDTLQLATSASADSYLWMGPNSYRSTLQNPFILNVNDSVLGIFTLIVRNSFSCTSQDTIRVFMDCEDIKDLFIPNVFTPNGDNENQLFKIEKADLKEVQVDIYNRWGIKVYSWNTLDHGWDGKTSSGEESPDGTYYYLINASTWRGRTITQKGSFSLFR